MSTILKQHAALPFSTELTNKRRKDIVCPQIKTKHAFSNRFFVFLGPLLYNKLNAKLNFYPQTYAKCKKTIQEALLHMSYDDTEELLSVLQ